MIPIVQMRYSYFGQSGWRSEASKQKEILFDPKRLAHRFNLLQTYAVRSLLDQEDQDFHFAMLTSEDLPKAHLKQVTEYIRDSFGDRGAVLARGDGPVFRHLIRHNRASFPEGSTMMQIVLDDDDALSVDFMARLKAEAAGFRDRLPDDTRRFFLSFSKGVSVVYEKGQAVPQLYRRDVPYTNLGLALVSPIDDRANPYAVAHKKVARRFASLVYNDLQPYYLRVVHGANDSRAQIDETQPFPDDNLPKLLKRFPLLEGVLNPPKARARAS